MVPPPEVVTTSELRREGAAPGRRCQIGRDAIGALSVQMDANGKTRCGRRVHAVRACAGLGLWLLLASALPLGGGCQVGGSSESGSLQTPLSQTAPSAGNEVPQPRLICQRSGGNQRIQYALELAQRGATYSARAELIKALKLVSRALDAEEHHRREKTGGVPPGAPSTEGSRSRSGTSFPDDQTPSDSHRPKIGIPE